MNDRWLGTGYVPYSCFDNRLQLWSLCNHIPCSRMISFAPTLHPHPDCQITGGPEEASIDFDTTHKCRSAFANTSRAQAERSSVIGSAAPTGIKIPSSTIRNRSTGAKARAPWKRASSAATRSQPATRQQLGQNSVDLRASLRGGSCGLS